MVLIKHRQMNTDENIIFFVCVCMFELWLNVLKEFCSPAQTVKVLRGPLLGK